MNSLSCCCSTCKPRYKRLVDHIYPRGPPFDAPISGNMQKLTFYSISHPEKLNRIGIYLVQRLSRDLGRQRVSDVKVAVDAMDQLLKSCHGSPSLNQFIESYLLMVQRLLETNEPQMEKLATDLFVRFSGIEEDSPSYNRQYDFFISKFSSMCYASQGGFVRSQRFNGLRGLRGVIWKSATDDLHANIWEKEHMNKIIPSILFNIQEENEEIDDHQVDHKTGMLFHHYPEEAETEMIEPKSLALQCLRELFQKCSFGSLKSVLEPVFKHLELHKKWDPPSTFAIKTFKAILYSIQSQNSYFVIQELINQLEQVPNNEIQVRVGMATVLSSIVIIAGTSIGPLLLAIFNSLLKLLRLSVEFQQSKKCANLDAEKQFQDTLINALGDFANALPDYQKVEIMMFTAGSIPNILDSTDNIQLKMMQTSEAFLQKVLVKTLLEVATKYKTFYLAAVFTDAFLKTLLQLQLTRDAEVRLIAQQIFHTLLDRHDNQSKLEHLPYSSDLLVNLQLNVEKCSRQDQLFMRRHVHVITSTLYRSVAMADKNQSVLLCNQLDAILCSMSLLCIEIGNDETQVELLRLAFSLQQMALESQRVKKSIEVHNLVALFLNLASQLISIPSLCQHVQQVIKTRAQRAHPLLNIINPNKNWRDQAQRDEKSKQQDDGGAYSPPPGKAPIAHMDSEDDGGQGSQQNSARKEAQQQQHDTTNSGNASDRAEKFDLTAEPGLLFCPETVYEGIKASNKEAPRLMQPFRPLAMSQSIGTAIGIPQQQQTSLKTNINGTPSFISIITAPDPPSSELNHSTSTSGGLMFSSPMNTRRNLSAVEISGMTMHESGTSNDNEVLPLTGHSTTVKLDGKQPPTTMTTAGGIVSQHNSVDTASIGSSSVDWSPPDSNFHSRRNTVLGDAAKQKELDLPITVEQLRILANAPLDLAEEERRDQEKSRDVLKLFRGKDAKELSALFRKAHHCGCSDTCKHEGDECAKHEETLAQTLQRLTARHEEKTKIRMFGQQAPPTTIFDIKFPASFEL